jgi:hypothetical protein
MFFCTPFPCEHMEVCIRTVSSDCDLAGIKKLQEENLRKNLSPEEALREGFVTAVYDLPFLKLMHSYAPSIISTDGDEVVGYALVVLRDIYGSHQLLDEMIDVADVIVYKQTPLKERNYVVCGQLCVKKGYRGFGLAQKMYGCLKAVMGGRFDLCVTDVARENVRSLRAHEKAGFEVIGEVVYESVEFDVVAWHWA